MPLGFAKMVAEQDRPKCDIEFVDVTSDRVFATGDGGKIKVWRKEDLQPVGELDGQQSGVCCIVCHGNRLYAGTAGGNIVVWDIEKGVVVKELNRHNGSLLRLRVHNDLIYSGDADGRILVWKNDELVQSYEVCEEVWDMALTDDLLYSVRDRDLVIQKIVQSDKANKLQMVRAVEGCRAPICRLDGKIFVLNRSGMDIQVLEDDQHTNFKQLGTIKQGQDRMLIALACGPVAGGKKHLYSGGWDGAVHSYDLETFSPLSRVELGQPVNCIRADPYGTGHVFVGANNGLLAKLRDS